MPQASRSLGSSVTRFSGRGSISPKEVAVKSDPPPAETLQRSAHRSPGLDRARQIAGVETGKVEAATCSGAGPGDSGRFLAICSHQNVVHEVAAKYARCRAEPVRTSRRA